MFLIMDVYIFYQWDSKERNLDCELHPWCIKLVIKRVAGKKINAFTPEVLLYIAAVSLLSASCSWYPLLGSIFP
jgi:hypothetical protein